VDDKLYQVLWNYWLYYPKPNASKPDKDAYLPRADYQKRWVFCHPNGERVKSVKIAFERACRKAGLKGISIYSLRHTFASHLIMTGVSIKTVQVLLGHKSISTTLNIYLSEHICPSNQSPALSEF